MFASISLIIFVESIQSINGSRFPIRHLTFGFLRIASNFLHSISDWNCCRHIHDTTPLMFVHRCISPVFDTWTFAHENRCDPNGFVFFLHWICVRVSVYSLNWLWKFRKECVNNWVFNLQFIYLIETISRTKSQCNYIQGFDFEFQQVKILELDFVMIPTEMVNSTEEK